MLLGQRDLLRVAHEALAQIGNAGRVGGREQQRLPLLRASLHNRDHVFVEAHIKHAVGFVQYQCLQGAEIKTAALQMVHDAARRADHNVGAMFQAGELRAHGAATAQDQHLDIVFAAGEAADFLRHLIGQFAGWAQHHGLYGKAARIEAGE